MNCENCKIIKNIKNYTKIDYIIALVGNPNVGKSTLFNTLTGMNVKVGNWPGKTVSKIEGYFEFVKLQTNQKYVFKIIDLPGVYSILSFTPEEEITRNFLLTSNYDICILILDSTNLHQSLVLALQVFEITNNVIAALNLIDEAKRKGIKIDISQLEQKLKLPIIPIIAQTGYNIETLIDQSLQVIQQKIKPNPIKYSLPPELQNIVEEIKIELIEYYPELENNPLLRWIILRILEGDKFIIELIKNKKLNQIRISLTK